MKVTRDPSDSLIIVTTRIWGPLGDGQISLALDTAATQTHVLPEFLDEIGQEIAECFVAATIAGRETAELEGTVYP